MRTHMIVLVIQHEDIKMLEQLHALEISLLHQMSFYFSPPNGYRQYYIAKLMEELIHILKCFCEKFKISDRIEKQISFPVYGRFDWFFYSKGEFAKYIIGNIFQHIQ